jgi:hypothetical protein
LAFIDSAFEQLLGRLPSAREQAASSAFLRRQTALLQGEAGSNPAVRAREDFVQALFSHNDFITVR